MISGLAFGATPVPFISQPPVTTPAGNISPGGTGFTLTLNGTGFATGATVNWTFVSGGTATTTSLSTITQTATRITVNIYASLYATPGTALISVVNNPTATALTSNEVFLQVSTATPGLYTVNLADYAVGNNPQGIVVADFNGDGILDLAVTNNADDSVSILLGNGDGTFTVQGATYSTGPSTAPLGIVAGHFTNSGHMDLAVVNNKDNTISILLGNGDGTFVVQNSTYATKSTPTAIVAGDFNGDGNVDLAVTNSAGNSVSVLLGVGDGTFKPQVVYSTGSGSSPVGLAVGALTTSGFLDLVVADKANGKVSVLLGKGDGTFQNHSDLTADKGTSSVVVADFNNDGIPDIVATNTGASSISYFQGNGGGTFQSAVAYTTDGTPFQAVVGDFTGDGNLDVALIAQSTANSYTCNIFLGKGNGVFNASSIKFLTTKGSVGIVAGDFNGDGRLDLAFPASTAKSVAVDLQAPQGQLVPRSFTFQNATFVGQMDQNETGKFSLGNAGSADLIIQSITMTGANSGDFAIVPSSSPCPADLVSGKTCQIWVSFTPTAAGVRTANVTVTDNNYNSPQTATVSGTGISNSGPVVSLSPTSLTFAAQSVGTTSAAQTVTLTNVGNATLTISSIVPSGDFAQTNNCPASLNSTLSCTINVTFSPTTTGTRTGAVTFTDNASDSPQTVSLTGTGTSPTVIPVPYIDQPLVPASTFPGNAAFTLTINGTGFYTNASVIWTFLSGGTATTTSLTPSCTTTTQCTVSIPANLVSTAGTAAITVVNPGSPSPARTSNVVLFPVAIPVTEIGLSDTDDAAGHNPVAVAVADFTGNGLPDVAVANNLDGTVSILLNNPTRPGTLENQVTFPTGQAPLFVIAADFNNDGKQDLAVVNNSAGTVSILLGNGDGTFQAKKDFTTGSGPTSVAAGDFNGDGNLDLAVTDSAADTVSILLGNGDGTFQTNKDISTGKGSGPAAVAVADLNHDGLLDLVVADGSNGKVSVLLGKGDGTFQTHVDYIVGKAPSSLAVADFNGDGKPDVISVNSGANGMSYLQGNGDGTFQTAVAVSLTSGIGPAQIVAADFNGDGLLDVAVTGTTAGIVTVLLGNGDGTFGSTLNFNTASGPVGIAAADFNGAGRIDLVTADSTAGKVSLELQGPSVSLSATSLSFSNQLVGTTSPSQSVVLTNSGSATLHIQSISTGTQDFAETNNCGSTVAAGGTCTITVTFSPQATGVRTDQVSIVDDAPGSPQTIALTGTGTAPAVSLSIDPNKGLTFISLDVGQTSAAQTVTVTNSGTATLTFSSIVVSGDIHDFGESNDCLISPANLAPNASCHINVTFTPTATGSRTGTVSINDNAPGSPQTFPLTGTGVEPVATVSPASLTFASQLVNTSSASQSITIDNTKGSGPLLISSLAITGTNYGDFTQTNTCGKQVGAGTSCYITVTFTPTAVGTRVATVTILDNNNGSNTTDSVALTGIGVAPSVSLSSTSLTFGPQNVRTTSDPPQIVTLTNSGSGALTITNIVSSSDQFGASNDCGTSLAAGANCAISVTFTPKTSGSQSGIITITDNNNGANPPVTQTINVSGTGAAASLTFDPTSLSFGSQIVGVASTLTVTVTNIGSAADTINAIAATRVEFTVGTDTCPRGANNFKPNATCTIPVTFTPKAGGQYNGLLEIADSLSPPPTAALSGMGSDFGIAVTPTSASVTAGNSVPYTIQVSPTGGFNQMVTLSCSGLPILSSCSFAPAATVTLDGTHTDTVTVTVSTTAASMLVPPGGTTRRPPGPFALPEAVRTLIRWGGFPPFSLRAFWLFALAIVAGYFGVVRRRLPLSYSLAVLALLVAATLTLPACGGGGGTALSRPGTTPGTYPMTITGAYSSSLGHSTIVTLTVN